MSIQAGKPPIVVTSASYISADFVSLLGIVWVPGTVSSKFLVEDGSGNPILGSNVATALVVGTIFPVMFSNPLPLGGLQVKALTSGDTLYIFLAE